MPSSSLAHGTALGTDEVVHTRQPHPISYLYLLAYNFAPNALHQIGTNSVT